MSLIKYASLEHAQVLELRSSTARAHHASLGKMADFHEYRTSDGFLYARIRAISSRVNRNHDGWPAIELAGGQDVFDRHTSSTDGFSVTADHSHEYGFSTFLGKPIFVDHHNTDPSRARGVIVDSQLHVDDHKRSSADPYYASKDVDPEHLPGTWVELLLEVDAKAFPKFAKAIVEGSRNPKKGIDGWSMGCDVERSVCSICKNAAASPEDYCNHIRMKGAHFDVRDPHTGRKTSRKAYENCYGVKFFEISGVFDPADETALSLEGVRTAKTQAETITQHPKTKGLKDLVDDQAEDLADETEAGIERRRKQNKGATRTAEAPLPQSEMSHAPEKVETLREEEMCPVCGSSMDEDTCDVCGYQEPPDGFGNPDLTKVQDADAPTEPMDDPRIEAPGQDITEGQPPPQAPEAVSTPSNPTALAHVTSDMQWEVPHTAARINKIEKPIVPTDKPKTNEPNETILSDQLQPVTSRVRTAEQFIAVAGATRRHEHMNHTADAASGAPAVAKPDVKTDVVGVGGVDQASNEAASKPDAQVDVLGIGSTGEDSVAAETEGVNVEQGDEHSKNIEAIHTQTWGPDKGDSLHQQDPVTNEPFPASEDGVKALSHWTVESYDDAAFPEGESIAGGSAVKGNQPIAESFGDRVNVLEHTTSPANNSGPTTTWTGTDGNGVNKQQDPVTNESIALGESEMENGPNWTSSAHIFTAMKLADIEVQLGLLAADRRYVRAAELERETPEVLAAELKYAQRVKEASVRRTAGVAKLPVMGRSNKEIDESKAADTAALAKTASTEDDAFMFGRV